jgi:phage terminase large subunit
MEPQKVRIKFLSAFQELFNEFWRYIVFYGGRSSGKSRSVAEALLIRGRAKKLRILCTREIQNTIRDSVHKLLKDLITQYEFSDYRVTQDSIVNTITGTEFIFKGLKHNITEIKSLEGIDICWIEEAQAVTKASLDILTPTIRKPGSQIIVTFNRFNELDPVFVHFVQGTPPKTFVKKINFDVLERAGLLPDVIKDEIEADRAFPSLFAYKWLGEPISQSDDAILGRDSVLEAMQRTIEADGQVIIGVDVARMGDDRTVFWKRQGLKTLDVKVYTKLRTTELCDKLEAFAGSKDPEIKIDDTGVGGGVTDEMKKRGYKVVPINFGARAKQGLKYPNLISEAWFQFGEIMNQIELPMMPDLLMELTTRSWGQDIKGKRRIESKADYKKRGFKSPDLADACIICYYVPKRVRAFADKPDFF